MWKNYTALTMINKDFKIIFLVASLSQPRCIKRITELYNCGYQVEVYGYNRGVYSVNKYPENITVIDLGVAENGGKYIKKVMNKIKVVRQLIIDNSDNENILFYSFSFDFTLSLLLLNRQVKYIYEISDLVYGYLTLSLLRLPFYHLDRLFCKKSLFTVLTSEGFNNYLFKDSCLKNILVQPNKVHKSLLGIEREKYLLRLKTTNKLRFGVVGSLRYPNTIFRFAKVVGQSYPMHTFTFYGESDLTPLAEEYEKKYENVHNEGPFRNPQDLATIYLDIDILICCYDTKTLNERLAEPNKLYEAICFCKPIVVSKNTYLEKKINTIYQIGYSIDASMDASIIDFIDSLCEVDLNNKSQKCMKIKARDYVDSIDTIDLFLKNRI